MWQIAFVTVGHLLILALALLGLRFLHRYTASSFLHPSGLTYQLFDNPHETTTNLGREDESKRNID